MSFYRVDGASKSGVKSPEFRSDSVSNIIILAGGKSTRMGRDKLELTLGGETLLQSVTARFKAEFDSVYLSVADDAKYGDVDAPRVKDIYHGAGPIGGLHAALSTLAGDGAFLVAADLPYATPQAARLIIDLCGEHDACIVRLPDGKLEPLFGFYRKTLTDKCEDAIKSGERRMTEVIYSANTRFVSPEMLGDLWSDKLLLNINYPEDYAAEVNNSIIN